MADRECAVNTESKQHRGLLTDGTAAEGASQVHAKEHKDIRLDKLLYAKMSQFKEACTRG